MAIFLPFSFPFYRGTSGAFQEHGFSALDSWICGNGKKHCQGPSWTHGLIRGANWAKGSTLEGTVVVVMLTSGMQ